MKNIKELKKLKELADIYSDHKHNAENITINNDNDCFEQDGQYSFASQTLDLILDILRSKDFDANIQYKDNVKEIIGNVIVEAIDKL